MVVRISVGIPYWLLFDGFASVVLIGGCAFIEHRIHDNLCMCLPGWFPGQQARLVLANCCTHQGCVDMSGAVLHCEGGKASLEYYLLSLGGCLAAHVLPSCLARQQSNVLPRTFVSHRAGCLQAHVSKDICAVVLGMSESWASWDLWLECGMSFPGPCQLLGVFNSHFGLGCFMRHQHDRLL